MSNFADRYFKQQNGFKAAIASAPANSLFLTVVIPAHNEPDLLVCINSLAQCHKPKHAVEVIVVINESEDTSAEVITQNQKSLQELHTWKNEHPEAPFTLHSIHPTPFKHKFRGVGSARKVGMDEAAYRYQLLQQPDGIIISLDADTTVECNYFTEIETLFMREPQRMACTLNFKHRINELSNPTQREGMQLYEQYLHYYKQALQFTGYPHAIYTIGSAFAFRAHAYVKQGGMPRRQAGEDFYFLHKLTSMGKLAELNSTCVYPSARVSNRVPFGTGPSIQKWLDGDQSISKSYHIEAFNDLRKFFNNLYALYAKQTPIHYSPVLNNFLVEEQFEQLILPELLSNSSNFQNFEKRFFQYFNAFKIIKFLNYAHPKPYALQPISKLQEELKAYLLNNDKH